DAYLAKPIGIDRLWATLEQWIPIDSRQAGQVGERPAGRMQVIDRSVLGAWLGDDIAAIRSILTKFANTAAEAEDEIRTAMRSGNLVDATAAAHKLNGAARAVGAIGLAEAAAAMEQASKAGDNAACHDAMGPLFNELQRALAAIASGF